MAQNHCPSTIPKDDLLSHNRIKAIWSKPGFSLGSSNKVGDAAEMEEFYIPNLNSIYKFTRLTADNFCVWSDALTTRYGDVLELDFISMTKEVLFRLSNHKYDICGLLDTLEVLALAVAEKSYKNLINSDDANESVTKFPNHILKKAFRNKRIFTRRLVFTFDKRVDYLTKTIEWHKANSDRLITAQEHLIVRRKKLHDAEKALALLQQRKTSTPSQQHLHRHPYFVQHHHHSSHHLDKSDVNIEIPDNVVYHDITPIEEDPHESMLTLETEDEGEVHVMNEFVNINQVKLDLPVGGEKLDLPVGREKLDLPVGGEKFDLHVVGGKLGLPVGGENVPKDADPPTKNKADNLPLIPLYASDEADEYDSSSSDNDASVLSVRMVQLKEKKSADQRRRSEELAIASSQSDHGVASTKENKSSNAMKNTSDVALKSFERKTSGSVHGLEKSGPGAVSRKSMVHASMDTAEESTVGAGANDRHKEKTYNEQELVKRIERYEDCLNVAMTAYKKRLRKVISSRDSLQYIYDDLMVDMRFEFLHRLRVSQENLRMVVESVFPPGDALTKYIGMIDSIDIDLVADSLIRCDAQKYIFPKLKPFIDRQPKNAILPHARIVDRNVPTSMKSLVALDLGNGAASSTSDENLHVQQIPEDDDACSVNSDNSEEFVHFMLKETGVLSDILVETVTDADLLNKSQKLCDVKVTKWCSVNSEAEVKSKTKERISLEVQKDVTERTKMGYYLMTTGKHPWQICPGFVQVKSKGTKVKVKCSSNESQLCFGWVRRFRFLPKTWGFFFKDDIVFNT